MKHLNPGLCKKNKHSLSLFSIVKFLISFVPVTIISAALHAQAVAGIVTDYNGYWKTAASGKSSTKPSNSHNLLAFTYNGTQYSTGVNDLLLSSHNETFVQGSFWSLPVSTISGIVNGNTKIGIGEMYDGIHNGSGLVSPLNSISHYLTDGVQGLNIGTGVANLPSGTMSFSVSSIKPQNIGDGVPDILVTQIADPSGSTDSYSFIDASGAIVGHKKDITFTNIAPVATWTADFYEASLNPMALTGGYTNTDRDLRLWAADLSDLGITAANYASVKKFVINLSGNSDLAFVAYNNMTFTFQTPLPVKLSDFAAKAEDNSSRLTWNTETETNTQRFIIERSIDNLNFESIGSVTAHGNSSSRLAYDYTDHHPANGINYYRLKIVDNDGQVQYSRVLQLKFIVTVTSASVYPNPCAGSILLTHPATKNAEIVLYNAAGVPVKQMMVAGAASQTRIDLQKMEKGVYYIVWQNGVEKISLPLLKSQ